VSQLEREGWLEHYAPTVPADTNGSTIFRVGRQLKRLLVMLTKSKRGKNQQNQLPTIGSTFLLLPQKPLSSLSTKKRTSRPVLRF
jgi:hypothetical protein